MAKNSTRIVGRAAHSNPANRFESVVLKEDFHEEWKEDYVDSRRIATEFIPDDSKSIISENNSPDLNFRYSLNAYRGCVHGCSYCYARTYHEYLGFSGGTDFETRILYKPKAAQLFTDWLNRKNYQCEHVNFSGGTDCYQPAEKRFALTRQCLEVALACGQPVSIVTKNALVLRDLDILQQLAASNLVQVNISLTTLDQQLSKRMEPQTSSPAARLRTIRTLSENGVPVRALLSPIIPGVNDVEIPRMLEAVSDAKAHSTGSSVVRLPGVVQEIFMQWLQRELPAQASLVESRIRQIRGGDLHDVSFNSRMTGSGEMARQIRATFRLFARKHGVDGTLPLLDTTLFRRPGDTRQRRLF